MTSAQVYGKAVAVNMKLAGESSYSASFSGLAALSLTKIGEIYLLMNKPDSALVKFNDALQKLNNCMFSWALMGGKGKCYVGIGKVYELKGDTTLSKGNDKATKYNFSLAYDNYKKHWMPIQRKDMAKSVLKTTILKYITCSETSAKLGTKKKPGNGSGMLYSCRSKKARLQIRDSYFNLSRFMNSMET